MDPQFSDIIIYSHEIYKVLMFCNVIKKKVVLLQSRAKLNEPNDGSRDNTLTAMAFINTVDHLPARNM